MENSSFASQSFENYSLTDGGPPVMYSSENPYEYSVPQGLSYLPEPSQSSYQTTYICGPTVDQSVAVAVPDQSGDIYENNLEFMNGNPESYPYTVSPSSTITEDGSTGSNSYYYPVYSDQYPLDSVRAAADSSSQSPDPQNHPERKSRKRRSPEVQARQRHAANERERRRMLSINKAFEKLRHRVPTLPYEKRLSKVDTLRLTIGYIHILEDLLKTDDERRATKGSEEYGETSGRQDSLSGRSICRPPPPKKVIVECHSAGQSNFEEDMLGMSTIRAHSLSWNKQNERNRDNPTLSAKLWVPQPQTPATGEPSSDSNH